jgi:hypothetical protein
MFVCLECGNLFHTLAQWEESRGECFGFPAYESYVGSPCCHGNYIEAFKCDACGEFITDDYYRLGDDRYCKDCVELCALDEEA